MNKEFFKQYFKSFEGKHQANIVCVRKGKSPFNETKKNIKELKEMGLNIEKFTCISNHNCLTGSEYNNLVPINENPNKKVRKNNNIDIVKGVIVENSNTKNVLLRIYSNIDYKSKNTYLYDGKIFDKSNPKYKKFMKTPVQSVVSNPEDFCPKWLNVDTISEITLDGKKIL